MIVCSFSVDTVSYLKLALLIHRCGGPPSPLEKAKARAVYLLRQ